MMLMSRRVRGISPPRRIRSILLTGRLLRAARSALVNPASRSKVFTRSPKRARRMPEFVTDTPFVSPNQAPTAERASLRTIINRLCCDATKGNHSDKIAFEF